MAPNQGRWSFFLSYPPLGFPFLRGTSASRAAPGLARPHLPGGPHQECPILQPKGHERSEQQKGQEMQTRELSGERRRIRNRCSYSTIL
jgi:hypothetical protein